MKVGRCLCLTLLLLVAALSSNYAVANRAIANRATGWLKATKARLATKALLLGTSLVLACGLISCDDPIGLQDQLLDAGFLTPEGDIVELKIGLGYDGTTTHNPVAGAQLAIDQINADGGINGVMLHLVARDNMGDSLTSYQIVEELVVDEEVQAFIGSSTYAQLVAEIAHRHKVPMLTTIVTNSNVTAAGNYVFMAAFSNEFQGQTLAQFARNELKANRAAIIKQDRKAYSRALANYFISTFEAEGGEKILAQESYLAGDTDFSAQLRAVMAFNPDVIFVAGVTPEVALIVKQGKAMGIRATFIGADGWAADDLIAIGGQALNGSFFLDHFSAKDKQASAETQQFIADYAAANGGELPSSPEALAYDAVRILVQALQRAGSLHGDAIRDEVAETEAYIGATKLNRYTSDRQAIKPAIVNKIENGKIIFYQSIPAPDVLD